MSPDLVYRMTDAKLITRLNDSRSAIVITTEVEQTHIVDWDPIALVYAAFEFDVEASDSEDSSSHQHNSLHSSRSSDVLSVVDAVIAEPKVRGTMKSAASAFMRSINDTPSSSSCTSPASPILSPNALSSGHNWHESKWPLLAQPRRVRMSSQLILVINEHKHIETMIAGDGRPPPDLMQTLERQAAAMSLHQHACETGR